MSKVGVVAGAGMDRRIRIRVHLALLSVQITFGAFHVFGKYVLGFLEPMALASIRAAAATPLLLLLAARAERGMPSRRDLPVLAGLPALARAPFGTITAGVWWAMAFIVLVPTVANYALNSWAIRHSSPTLVATYTTLQPVSAALLAMMWLGDKPGWGVAVGFVLILAGLWAVAGGNRKPVAGSR